MISENKYFVVLTLFVLIMFSSCKDKWEEHNEILEPVLSKSLQQQVAANSELSLFNEYLAATGYDQLLASTKTFTVWAPSNAALQGLDESIINDAEKLKQFVGNHISFQQYFTTSSNTPSRIKTINGKYINFNSENLTIEDALIVEANKYCYNGVLHIIDKAMVPKLNIWEFFNGSVSSPKLLSYIKSLDHLVFVDSLATTIGVDSLGKPKYQPGTGNVLRNKFLDEVHNVNNEDSLFTFIMLTDDAFESEKAKLVPYFYDSVPGNTENHAGWSVVKDLVIKGQYDMDHLPDTLVSSDQVKVPIDKSAITSVYKTSNGIVYIMNKCDFKIRDKIRPIIIQGEKPNGFSHLRPSNTFYRNRIWASEKFDILIQGHAVSTGIYIYYRVDKVNSVKYKVYTLAVNDFQGGILKQSMSVGSPTATKVDIPSSRTIPTPPALPDRIEEKELMAQLNVTKYGFLRIYIHSDAANPVVLDYIKLVPVLP